MTTIITRLYPDAATAQGVVADLLNAGHDLSTIDVIVRNGAADLAERLQSARVSPEAAAAYTRQMVGSTKALLVVRAGFNPLGAARNAIKVTARYPSLGVGLADENQYVREDGDYAAGNSVMKDHPLWMSNKLRPTSHAHILGSDPIIHSKTGTSAIRGGAFMSTKFWPMRLVSAQAKTGTSAIRGGKLFLTTLIGSR
jgi:hypothetical protein